MTKPKDTGDSLPIPVLQERYAYCPDTGIISHKRSRGQAKTGEEAGFKTDDGYRAVKVSHEGKRVQIMAHILAWVLHNGVWPEGDVDHRDTNRLNNSIGNLRQATRSQNLANRNKVGELPKGVTRDPRNKTKPFRAQLKRGGKNYYLGHFDCPVQASEAYFQFALTVYGEFVRV